MLHPDLMIQIENKRLQDFRNEATDRHLAKLAKGDKPNRLNSMIKGFTVMTKWMKSQTVDRTQHNKITEAQLGNKQA